MVHPRRFRRFLVLATLFALAAMACGEGGAEPTQQGAAPESDQATETTATAGGAATGGEAPSGEPLRVGALFALSGPQSASGLESVEGLELLFESINAAGGVEGRPLELITADWESSPDLVVPRARELLAEDIVMLLGLETSAILPTVEPIVEAAQVPVISAAGTNPQNPWSFAAYPLTGYIDLMASYPLEQGHDFLCGMHVPGGNQETQENFVYPLFEEVGNPARETIGIELGATDLTPQMTVFREAGCNVVYVAITGDAIVKAAQAAANLGMDDILITTHGGNANPTNVEALGANADQVYFAVPKAVVADQLPDSDPNKEQILAFFEEYEAAAGSAPTANVVIGYAMGQLAVDALATGTTGQELRDYIETQSVPTILGQYEKSAENHNGAQSEGYFVMGRWDPEAARFVLD